MNKLFQEAHDKIVASAEPLDSDCGVYFLVAVDRVVYVGQSVHMSARIQQHLTDKRKAGKFNKVAKIYCPKDQLDYVEAAFIHAFQPPLNGCNLPWPVAPLSVKRVLERLVESH